MLDILWTRLKQKKRTLGFPKTIPALPDRFRGLPVLNESPCPSGCRECAEACPTHAVSTKENRVQMDLGRCLFCTDCQEACPKGSLRFSQDYRLAARRREDFIFDGTVLERTRALEEKQRRLFGRSLKLRQVSAGGCSACEADIHVLNTVVFDLGRFGIQLAASPRHADGLLITGAVSENMKLALQKTYEAVPAPKIVIAVGACAISGGPYIHHPEALGGANAVVPVDLYIPGCPPHPITILDGLLGLLQNC